MPFPVYGFPSLPLAGVTSSDAVQYRCLSAVHSTIQGLGLDGIANASIVLRKLPSDREQDSDGRIPSPAVVVSLAPFPETNLGGTNARDDWGFPVYVAICKASNQSLTVDEAVLDWRQTIRKAFHWKRLSGVSEVMYCLWEPQAVINLEHFFERNLDVSSAIIRCVTREARS